MIIFVFKARFRSDKVEEARSAFEMLIPKVRGLEGVVSFDFAQDITDSNVIIGTQVYEDREAWMREESLPEVRQLVTRLGGLIETSPEMSVYEATQLPLPGEEP